MSEQFKFTSGLSPESRIQSGLSENSRIKRVGSVGRMDEKRRLGTSSKINRHTVQELRRRFVHINQWQRRGAGELGPFTPILGSDDGGTTWYVVVTDGYVIGRKLTTNIANADDPWIPTNIMTAGVRTKFAITASQAIRVKVITDIKGNITACTLECGAAGDISIGYQPEVGPDNAGQAGTHYYKLAVANAFAPGARPILTHIYSKSHIDHYPFNPTWVSAGDSANTISVLKDLDETNGKYRTRGIAKDPATGVQLAVALAANGNDILLRGNSVNGSFKINGGSTLLEWLDGLIITAGPIDATVSGGSGTTGITGYFEFYWHDSTFTYAGLMWIKVVDGVLTEKTDAWTDQAGSATTPAGYGSLLGRFRCVQGGSYIGITEPYTNL